MINYKKSNFLSLRLIIDAEIQNMIKYNLNECIWNVDAIVI